MPRPPKLVTILATVAIAILVAGAGVSAAPLGARAPFGHRSSSRSAGSAAAPAGRDVSFPQCGTPLPRRATFGVLGVNGGTVFSKNPCLLTQLRWARSLVTAVGFYANTGNPGPAHSNFWPIGQTSPRVCSRANPNSLGCSFDYGWNAAFDSFRHAVDAVQTLHGASRANARGRAADVDWWLDVEILNSWQTILDAPTVANQRRDTEALAGAVNAFWSLGVKNVGIYGTSYQWRVVTGGRAVAGTRFSSNSVWLAGFASRAHAERGCGLSSFTGGAVRMTQYLGPDRFDADIRCR